MFVSCCVVYSLCCSASSLFFFFQAEDGIRDLVRSRGLGDVYKRQVLIHAAPSGETFSPKMLIGTQPLFGPGVKVVPQVCLLYTSDAADERSSVDLGGRRIIKKTTIVSLTCEQHSQQEHAYD